MRRNRDHADGTFGLERAEQLGDLALRRAETDWLHHLDRYEVAVARVAGPVRRNGELLAKHLLVHRFEPAAAVRAGVENAEHAMLRPVEDADDAAAIADIV